MTTNRIPKARIRVNDDRLRLPSGDYPVADIKARVEPPIPDDHTLWIDNDGSPDTAIDQDGIVTVEDGLVLYSQAPDGGAHPRPTRILIDGSRVESPNVSVTGALLRQMVAPPIPSDRDLFRDIDGAPDERIADDEEVTLVKGAEFYSVPRLIAPGCP